MIGAARVADGDSPHSHVLERSHPRVEDRTLCLDALHVHAANLAAAVIHVEVGGELLLLARRMEAEGVAHTVVLAYVRGRPQQSLLFASPESDADRAPRLEIQRLDETHRLEHHTRAHETGRNLVCRLLLEKK